MQKVLIVILFTLSSLIGLGQNQNLSNAVVFDGEPYLSIDPSNSQHLVVAWMSWVSFANKIQIKTRASFDGGQTWSSATALPHVISSFTSADPCIEFNHNGEVLISYIDFTGFNVNPMNGAIYLCKSADGGLSWGTPVEVMSINADLDRRPIDRPWMSIDRSSGPNQGNIYITSMNAMGALPDYHPYVSISTDGGNSFTWQDLDGPNWLSGNLIPQPMPTPEVTASGTFYAIYPSFVLSQNLAAQFVLASSSNGGSSFAYTSVLIGTANSAADSLEKKGYLLRANPADPNHLVFVALAKTSGDLDVYLTESFNGGSSWSAQERINDDPIGNDRVQDLLWADFDNAGSLIVSWRDRRNGTNNTFETASEIWAAFRHKDSANFAANFQITDQTVAYDTVLASSGNDFMCIKMEDGALNATWADPRDGKLNIWYQKLTTDGTVLSLQKIASELLPEVALYPNPTSSTLTVKSRGLTEVRLYSLDGKRLLSQKLTAQEGSIQLNIEPFPSGSYFVEVLTRTGTLTKKVQKL